MIVVSILFGALALWGCFVDDSAYETAKWRELDRLRCWWVLR